MNEALIMKWVLHLRGISHNSFFGRGYYVLWGYDGLGGVEDQA
jgi:hypothetical protein